MKPLNIFRAAGLAILAVIVVIFAGCASKPAEPVIIYRTQEVERIVQVKCMDTREALGDLPDDDDDLASVNLDDPRAVFVLSQKYVAARQLYRQRLNADDVQIKACAGD